VTYSRDTEYDREIFRRFGDFLSRELRRPNVFLDRDRIIRRHLQAVLLAGFLRSKQPAHVGAMHAFGRMGKFCDVTCPSLWTNASPIKPKWMPSVSGAAGEFLGFLEDLKKVGKDYTDRLSGLAVGTPLAGLQDADSWAQFVDGAVTAFMHALEEWKTDIDQLRDAWCEIADQPSMRVGNERAKANAIRYQVRELCEITVIEWFADRRFLPRYGFPINIQRLRVRRAIEGDGRDRSEPDERYRLERSSLLALSEYVPESRVLVGNRVVVSRGLRKHWTDSNVDRALGLQSLCLTCPEEHVYIGSSSREPCPACGANPCNKQKLVFPRFGYTTAGWDPPRREIYPERIGEQSVCPIAFVEKRERDVHPCFAGVESLSVTYREEAQLLVRNAGARKRGFAICTRCGFAMSETEVGEGQMHLPDVFEAHAPVFSSNAANFCWQKGETDAPVLRNRVLAARELTDMMLVEWPGATRDSEDAVYSLGRALLLAGTRLLELDGRELGAEVIPLQGCNRGVVIFETSMGGAGHCLGLFKQGRQWIELARKILFVNEDHHARCRRACLDCILDFSGQYRAHQLDRLAALQLMDDALR
jgi:DEAD/DEAH box helicase domain-containing protein